MEGNMIFNTKESFSHYYDT